MEPFFFAAVVCAAAAAACPAVAGPAETVASFETARTMFMGGQGRQEFMTKYPAFILDGIDGTWAALSSVVPGGISPEPGIMQVACSPKIASAIVRKDDYGFALTRQAATEQATTTTFTSRGGNGFVQSVDPDELLPRLGIADKAKPEEMRMTVLANTQGLAIVIRAAPDILIIETEYGPPQIYGRCS